MTAMLSKADLRAAALAKRDALSDEQRAAAAQAIAKRGLPFEIAPGMVVSGYSPIRSEIDPVPLMRKLAEQGARLALPAVLARGKSLAFRAWSPDDRLMLGPLGILEPSPAAAEVDSRYHAGAAGGVRPRRATASAMAPGITTARSRICAKRKPSRPSALAFAVQEIKAVPALPHDVALDYVLTETESVRFPESELCAFFSSVTSSAGPAAPPSRNICPAWSATGRSISSSSMARTPPAASASPRRSIRNSSTPAPMRSRSAITPGIRARRWCSSSARRGWFAPRIFRRARRAAAPR